MLRYYPCYAAHLDDIGKCAQNRIWIWGSPEAGKVSPRMFFLLPRFVTYLLPHGVKRSTVYYTTATVTIFMRFTTKFIFIPVFSTFNFLVTDFTYFQLY